MKVNRERFLAAALALSTAAGCKLSRGDDVTTQAAPETPAVPGASPFDLGTEESSQVGAPAAAAGDPSSDKSDTAKSRTRGIRSPSPTKEALLASPTKEGIAPTKEAVSPTKEAIASPTKEALTSPTKEALPKPSPTNEYAKPPPPKK